MSVRDIFRGPAKTLLAAVGWQRAAIKHMREPLPLFVQQPNEVPAGLKIHIGAGEINLQGWINVDARPLPHIHALTTSLALNEFSDGAVAAIYMCHVLEHVSFDEARQLVSAFHTKLVAGGVLIISVPDFDALVRLYHASNDDLDSIKHPLMGGQGYEYNFHKSVYNHAALERLLHECGFADVARWRTDIEFGDDLGDWSSKTMKAGNGEIVPVSLNLKARKVGRRT